MDPRPLLVENLRRESPSVHLGFHLEGDELVHEPSGARLDLEIVTVQLVHGGPSLRSS